LSAPDDRTWGRADHRERRGGGRDFGAWLGLVPKQESTGDRTILGKIPKRGNKYLRTLFVQAARVAFNGSKDSRYPLVTAK